MDALKRIQDQEKSFQEEEGGGRGGGEEEQEDDENRKAKNKYSVKEYMHHIYADFRRIKKSAI